MAPAAGGQQAASSHARDGVPMNIGAVLAMLQQEFPDVSISKIRYLEDQGLVEPERTPSGYRKFFPGDVDRLRYVLGVQRDNYLPLRVIRDHLEALDAGLEPPVTRGPRPARLVGPPEQPRTPRRLGRRELLEAARIDEATLADLESHGVVTAHAGRYDEDTVLIAAIARRLADFGIEPRHLRAFRAAADREAGLVEQVVAPLRRQRDAEVDARAEEASRELTALCLRLHAVLVKAALDRDAH